MTPPENLLACGKLIIVAIDSHRKVIIVAIDSHRKLIIVAIDSHRERVWDFFRTVATGES